MLFPVEIEVPVRVVRPSDSSCSDGFDDVHYILFIETCSISSSNTSDMVVNTDNITLGSMAAGVVGGITALGIAALGAGAGVAIFKNKIVGVDKGNQAGGIDACIAAGSMPLKRIRE